MAWYPWACWLGAIFSGGCLFGELRERRPRARAAAAWGFCTGAFAVLTLVAVT